MKAPKIILKNYEKLLIEVRGHVKKTEEKISKIVTRQKVEMAWSIGKSITQHLQKNNPSEESSYGEHLFKQLASDSGIDQKVLYKMRSFYETYPKLPQENDKLNWSHYRVLSGVKNDESRKYLEDLTQQKNLDAETLRKKVKKSRISEIRDGSALRQKTATPKKLTPKRGQLFCYKLTKIENSKKKLPRLRF